MVKVLVFSAIVLVVSACSITYYGTYVEPGTEPSGPILIIEPADISH
jgi:hypothetical protein